MSMVCGLDLHRQQITFDAMDTVSGEVWRGRVWQPDRDRFRRWLSHDVAAARQRGAGGDGGGGLHRLALRGRGDRGRRVRGARRRAGRHAGGAGPQAPRQDRSFRRPVVARVVAAWRAARVVDPADGGVGVAGTGAAVQVAARSAPGVDPADPRRVVPTRRRRPGRRDRHPGDTPVAGRRRRDADRSGPAADRRRLRDDRRHQRPRCSR